jgi:hypothetical protein
VDQSDDGDDDEEEVEALSASASGGWRRLLSHMAVKGDEPPKGGEEVGGVLKDEGLLDMHRDVSAAIVVPEEEESRRGEVATSMAALRPSTIVQREEQTSRRMESGEREASQRRLPPGYIRPDPGLVRRIHNHQELRQRVVSQIQALVFAMPVGDIGEEDSGFVKQLLEGLQKALRGEELPAGKVAAVVNAAVRGARVTMTIGELYAAAPGLQSLIDDAIRAVLPRRDAAVAAMGGGEHVVAAASSVIVPEGAAKPTTVVPVAAPIKGEGERPLGGVMPLPPRDAADVGRSQLQSLLDQLSPAERRQVAARAMVRPLRAVTVHMLEKEMFVGAAAARSATARHARALMEAGRAVRVQNEGDEVVAKVPAGYFAFNGVKIPVVSVDSQCDHLRVNPDSAEWVARGVDIMAIVRGAGGWVKEERNYKVELADGSISQREMQKLKYGLVVSLSDGCREAHHVTRDVYRSYGSSPAVLLGGSTYKNLGLAPSLLSMTCYFQPTSGGPMASVPLMVYDARQRQPSQARGSVLRCSFRCEGYDVTSERPRGAANSPEEEIWRACAGNIKPGVAALDCLPEVESLPQLFKSDVVVLLSRRKEGINLWEACGGAYLGGLQGALAAGLRIHRYYWSDISGHARVAAGRRL